MNLDIFKKIKIAVQRQEHRDNRRKAGVRQTDSLGAPGGRQQLSTGVVVWHRLRTAIKTCRTSDTSPLPHQLLILEKLMKAP